tara:strand:- start:500 stop:1105 length:606 start_codon:yes stop_codon:yes gene_type:complete
MNEEYNKLVLTGGRPIPGQSLTSDPSSPAPYEKPPQYTSVHEASEEIFAGLIEEETYKEIMGLLSDGLPVMDIVQTLLFAGFKQGKWNPDLMLMLVEPAAYMILALAERAGIDPKIYQGEEEDEAEERVFGVELKKEKVARIKKLAALGKTPSSAITEEMVETIEQLPVSEMQSLMERPTETPPPAEESLMAQQPVQEEEV